MEIVPDRSGKIGKIFFPYTIMCIARFQSGLYF
jgi:hypothetical protein